MLTFLKRFTRMINILGAFDLSDISIDVVPPFVSPLYFQSFGIPLECVTFPPSTLSSLPVEERVDGPTSPEDLEIYGYYVREVLDAEASSSPSSPPSYQCIVPPIRYLLFDLPTRRLFPPSDIERDELRRFLLRKMKEYPDIFSSLHRAAIRKAVNLIMSRLDCESFAISSSLIGRADEQIEGLSHIVENLGTLSCRTFTHLRIVLCDHYKHDEKHRTLYLPWNGDFPFSSEGDDVTLD
jgi:hypothetical protein